jgi:hypothetical protein
MLFANGTVAVGLLALALPAWLLARWFDSYHRKSVLYYDLEPEAGAVYEKLVQAFDGWSRAAASGTSPPAARSATSQRGSETLARPVC